MPTFLESIIDIQDLKGLPFELAATFKPKNVIAKGYPFWTLRGDTTAFLMLFFDILATQMGGIGAAVYGVGFTHAFIYSHWMGGAGISLLFGNAYYALQASKLAMKTGKMDVCAQPYGINTPGMFAKIFGIMAPCLYSALAAEYGKGPFITGNWGDTSDATPEELEGAMTIAWNVACCVNLIGGFVEIIGAFVAPLITRNVPQGAFLVPLAGIGATWLGYAPLKDIMASHFGHFPIVGFIPLMITWLGFFGSDFANGKYLFGQVPPVLLSCVVGVILCVICNPSGYTGAYETGVTFLGKGGISFPDFSVYGTDYFASYGNVGLVMGLSFTNFIGTFGCNVSARLGGDVTSPMEQMVVDGTGTVLGALFGSPLGTTVYIGHPTYKKFGATRGYSLINGLMYFIVGMVGAHGLLDAIIPHEILLGSLVCVGFVIVQQTFEEAPSRWYPAVAIGICICFSDFIVNLMGLTPDPSIKVFSSGYVWVSFLWTWFFMMLTDRWFKMAALVFVILGCMTAVGFCHSAQAGFVYDADGMHVGGIPGTTPTWKYIVTYFVAAAVCVVLHLFQRIGKLLGPVEEDYRKIQIEMYATPSQAEAKESKPVEVAEA